MTVTRGSAGAHSQKADLQKLLQPWWLSFGILEDQTRIGGLIRAYGGVAQVLEQSEYTPFEERVVVAFSYAYSDSNVVSQVLSRVKI